MEFLVTVTSASTSFVDRHIGARRQSDVDAMLKAVGYDTVDALVDTAVPKDIRQDSPLSAGTSSRPRPGTRPTRRTSRRSPRAGSRRC